MAIDFPSSPVNGQSFVSGNQQWVWDGTKWVASGIASGLWVPVAGGVMTGPLTTPGISAPQAIGDNRIINGDFRIDQRNNGAGGTAQGYTVDRWMYSNSTAPTGRGTWQRQSGAAIAALGFPYFLAFTSSSAYVSLAGDSFHISQPIEADMVSDFAWGTANAQPVTLSFWVYSSLTGVFSGAIRNAPTPSTRSYPFTFSIPTAATWTNIVITIPGDTAGTWVMNGNAVGLYLHFDLGSGTTFRGPAGAWAAANYVGANGTVSVVGTNGASFNVTGVKLEVGNVATPYNRQSLAKSLADCQRYFYSSYGGTFNPGAATNVGAFNYYQTGLTVATNGIGGPVFFPSMRASPTILTYSNITGVSNRIRDQVNNADVTPVISSTGNTSFVFSGTMTVASGTCNMAGQFTATAEL
jgi:hypothetical protein